MRALGERIAETVGFQLASVALARAASVEPGRFRTAMKVTLTEWAGGSAALSGMD